MAYSANAIQSFAALGDPTRRAIFERVAARPAAVGVLAREARLVVEPSGAVAPSAFLFHGSELPPGRTVAVISGGNLEPELFAELVVARLPVPVTQ